MKTADINGDGNADAITIHEDDTRVLAGYVGNGTGSVGAPITTPFTNGLLKSTIGDFNSDGKDDVLVIDDVNRGFVMLSNGNGSFAAYRIPDNFSSVCRVRPGSWRFQRGRTSRFDNGLQFKRKTLVRRRHRTIYTVRHGDPFVKEDHDG
ncbi:MAG: VCBS repeat-containing protein [Acidobacteria bacterium]|nr:VCBS repeat-containing protein [Acidobacteriota bacterium]